MSATIASLVAALTVAACGGGDGSQSPAAGKEPGAAGKQPAAAANRGLPQGSESVKLDPAKFTTNIDNPYWPMNRAASGSTPRTTPRARGRRLS